MRIAIEQDTESYGVKEKRVQIVRANCSSNVITMLLTKEELSDIFLFDFFEIAVQDDEILTCTALIKEPNRFRFVSIADQNMDEVFDFDDMPEYYTYYPIKERS